MEDNKSNDNEIEVIKEDINEDEKNETKSNLNNKSSNNNIDVDNNSINKNNKNYTILLPSINNGLLRNIEMIKKNILSTTKNQYTAENISVHNSNYTATKIINNQKSLLYFRQKRNLYNNKIYQKDKEYTSTLNNISTKDVPSKRKKMEIYYNSIKKSLITTPTNTYKPNIQIKLSTDKLKINKTELENENAVKRNIIRKQKGIEYLNTSKKITKKINDTAIPIKLSTKIIYKNYLEDLKNNRDKSKTKNDNEFKEVTDLLNKGKEIDKEYIKFKIYNIEKNNTKKEKEDNFYINSIKTKLMLLETNN